MKKTLVAVLFSLIAVLAVAGTASAQTVDDPTRVYCPATATRPAFYSDTGVCPTDVVRPPDDGGNAAGELPRTGSDSLPLAKMAIVLIGVGGGLTLVASRKHTQSVSS